MTAPTPAPIDFLAVAAEAMVRTGMTQAELVAASGVAQSRVSDFLAGRRGLSQPNLAAVLTALRVRVTPPRRGRAKR